MVPASRPEPTDEVLTLLGDHHRRSIVSYFGESSADNATLADLADFVSERNDEPSKAVAAKLRHVELPRFAEAGVPEYDLRSRTVRYRGSVKLEAIADCIGAL